MNFKGWKYRRKLLKPRTTAEQGEKRSRTPTFLRDSREGAGRTKPDPTQPQQRGPAGTRGGDTAGPSRGSTGRSPSSSAGPAPGAPAPGGHSPPHPAGPPPQHPGVSPTPSPHCGATSPRAGTGGRSAPARGSAHAAPPLRSWGFRGAAPPAGSGTHQFLCVFHQALMGRSCLLPLRAHPRGSGAAGARGRGRARRGGGGPGSSAAPSSGKRPGPTAAAGTSTTRAHGCAGADTPPPGSGCAGRPHCHIPPTLGEIIRYRGWTPRTKAGTAGRVRAAVPASK